MGIKKMTSANNPSNLPVGIGLGVLTSILITLLCAAGITHLITSEKMADSSMGYVVPGVLFLAALAGAWVAAVRTKRLRLPVCLLEGGGYFLALLATTALFFGGQYKGIWASALVILLGSLLTAVLPSVGQKKIKVKNRAYR